MANHFSQLAKKSRTNGSSEKIAKEQTGKPSLDIYKLGDDVLRQNSKRITKVDESIRKPVSYTHLTLPTTIEV